LSFPPHLPDLGRTPGGSSGGSAAALAAGFAYLAMGSDIGGSIRVPAHFCGVCGLKATLGLVPRRGHIPPPPSSRPQPSTELAVAGPMARTAPDLTLALEVLGGPAAPEAIAYRWRLPAPRHYALRQYRVGYVLDDPSCPVGSDVKAAERRLNKPDSPVNTRACGCRGRASPAFRPSDHGPARPFAPFAPHRGALRRADPAQRADRSTPRPPPRSRPAPTAPRLPRRREIRPPRRAPAGEGRGFSFTY
jgi:hypothetical protein